MPPRLTALLITAVIGTGLLVALLLSTPSKAVIHAAPYARSNSPVASITTTYSVVDLGPVIPLDINNRGQIVGVSGDAFETESSRAFLWEEGSLIYLFETQSGASAINNDGHVVGEVTTESGTVRGFLWKDGAHMLLSLNPNCPSLYNSHVWVYDINDNLEIVGSTSHCVQGPDGATYAVRWKLDGFSVLIPRGNQEFSLDAALGINNLGHIVGGESLLGVDSVEGRSFLWKDGKLTGLLPSTVDWRHEMYTAAAINDVGQILLPNYTEENGFNGSFIWHEGVTTPLPISGHDYGYGMAINNHGDVVGTVFGYSNGEAVIWRGGELITLTSVLPSGSGWILHEATGINDRGDIIGVGTHSGMRRGFLLTASGVSGQVIDADGNPLPGVTISTQDNLTAVTDNEGRYSFEDLPKGTYRVSAQLEGYPFLPEEIPVTVPPGDEKADFHAVRPLIFVPGIAGSLLHDGNQEQWPALEIPSNKSKLSLDPTNTPHSPIVATDVIRRIDFIGSIISYEMYNPLLQFLVKQEARYVEYNVNNIVSRRTVAGCDFAAQKVAQPTLFVFAYDWRLSNSDSALQLTEYVRCVHQFYPESEIDIVAHSMGGLIARRYILDNPQDHHVAKLVTIGAPWLGAPKALNALQTGKFFNDPAQELLIVGKPELQKLAEFFPGVHELLPTRIYHQLEGHSFIEDTWDLNANGVLNETYTYTQTTELLDRSYPDSKPGTASQVFHERPGQDSGAVLPHGVDYYHIYGKKPTTDTITAVHAVEEKHCRLIVLDCYVRNTYRVSLGLGGGTVPITSSIRSGLNDGNAVLRPITTGNADHNGMVSDPKVHKAILGYLQPTIQQALVSTTPDAALTVQPGYYLWLSSVSTVTLADEFGNRLEPVDDYFLKTVPNTSYYQLDEFTHVMVLPSDQTFTMTFSAPTEPFAMDISYGPYPTIEKLIRYQDLSLPPNVNTQLVITPMGARKLQYDSNGDGTVDTDITPTVDVSGEMALDDEPPLIQIITITQQPGTRLVEIDANDNASGVKTIYYSLGNNRYQVYSQPFELSEPASVTLSVFAEDNVGNRSSIYRVAGSQPLYLPEIQR
jgi:probable HAF family extracellular repeat protein